MRRSFRRPSARQYVLIPFAVVAISLLIPATASAGTPATVDRVTIETTALNPCTGHLISISGVQRLVERTVIEGGVQHTVVHAVDAGIKGVDVVTGETYVWIHQFVNVLYWDLGVPTQQTAEAIGMLVGPSGTLRFKSLLHYTVAASGSLTASFDRFEIACM